MDIIISFIQIIGIGIATMLPLANPLTAVVLMLSLGSRLSQESYRRQSRLAAIYTFAIMICSFYFGHLIMNGFGISIPGLRISGGVIVAYIGFRMLFPDSDPTEQLAEKQDESQKGTVTNIAFIPLAMPGTAGPGTIAMIISLASTLPKIKTAPTWILMTAPAFSFLFLAGLLWVALRFASRIMEFLGKDGIDAISRLMGFILVCMGIQFCIDGVLEIITSFNG